MRAEEIFAIFNDSPVQLKEKRLFVNREEQLRILNNVGAYIDNSIFGLSGPTGIGKTSLLNLSEVEKPEVEKILIEILRKESREGVAISLLYQICSFILSKPNWEYIHKIANQGKSFIQLAESKTSGSDIKAGKIIEIGKRRGKTLEERLSIENSCERIEELLNAMTRSKKIFLCIDEIDKENKRDAILIIDSLKDVLRKKNVATIISLPR